MSPRTSPAGVARVALLGCGTVGRAVAAELLERGEALGASLVSVLVRDASRERGIPAGLITTDIRRVFDSRPDVIIEAIGGVEPAGDYVTAALKVSIPVVTANKSLVAHRGAALRSLATEWGVSLRYEGAVGGAAPVLAAFEQLRGDRVTSIRGVINGTCNFILSRLASGVSFGDALAEAQARGFAEADPSADVSGRDSAEKLCILASEAGCAGLTPGAVRVQGIEGVTPDDLAAARRSRRALKLVAELEVTEHGVHARVGPALIAEGHPLANLGAEQNGVVIRATLAGEIFVQGPGAGGPATASAVLGDLRRVLAGRGTAPAALRESRPHRAAEPRRQQVFRVHASADRLSPERLFAHFRDHRAEPAEVVLERGRVRASAVLDDRAALALGLAVAGPTGHALVTPLLT